MSEKKPRIKNPKCTATSATSSFNNRRPSPNHKKGRGIRPPYRPETPRRNPTADKITEQSRHKAEKVTEIRELAADLDISFAEARELLEG